MVQVLCFSAEVTVETPVASRKKTSLGLVRTPLSASVPHATFLGFEASLYLLGGAMGHKARELKRRPRTNPGFTTYSLNLKGPFTYSLMWWWVERPQHMWGCEENCGS